jgi:hypothetical protein
MKLSESIAIIEKKRIIEGYNGVKTRIGLDAAIEVILRNDTSDRPLSKCLAELAKKSELYVDCDTAIYLS